MKLKWKVSEPSTGPYRSFHRRGWPMAYYANGEPAAALYCDDEYTPSRARGESKHAEIRINVADHSVLTSDGRPTFKWVTAVKRGVSLDHAKMIAAQVIAAHPQFMPKKEKP